MCGNMSSSEGSFPEKTGVRDGGSSEQSSFPFHCSTVSADAQLLISIVTCALNALTVIMWLKCGLLVVKFGTKGIHSLRRGFELPTKSGV